MDTLIGTSIGGYTLTKLLGAGGMGSVYLANDPAIGQQVAVKLIRTDLDDYTDSSSAQRALSRFRQEARAVASLDHLHILQLYRYGEEPTPGGSRAFMIMQYRPEGSLWDWLRRRADLASGQPQALPTNFPGGLPTKWPLELDEANEYLQQAASALQYAHDRGIVHRDVKPANFLLRVEPQATSVYLLLSDFGLAKVFTASSATNTILGTPTYMAPEQFDGAARPESDQYALAVMVYYLLAGHPPFEGDALQLMRQHLTSPMPAIANLHPAVSSAVQSVLARALAKVPEQRFPSVAAFASAFSQVASGQQTVQGSGAFGQFSPGVSSNFVQSQPFSPGMDRSPAPIQVSAGASPYEAAAPTTPMLYPRDFNPTPASHNTLADSAATMTPPQVPGPSGAGSWTDRTRVSPAWQPVNAPPPGGQKIKRRGALGWIIGGGAAIVVLGAGAGTYFYLRNRLPQNALFVLKGHSQSVTSLSWLPGGTQLASGSLDETVRLWSASSGSAIGHLSEGAPVRSVAWNTDGSLLAVGTNDNSLAFWNAGGSRIRNTLAWGADVKALAWLNKDFIFLGTYGLGLHAYDIAAVARYGKDDLLRVNSISLSPDKSLLALALESGLIYLADLGNNWKDVYHFNADLGAALSIAWSPDGNYIAVGYANNTVLVYNVSSKQAQYVLKHNSYVSGLAWNPGASGLMLASGAGDATVNIWDLSAASQSQTIYHGHSGAVLAVAWSATMLASASEDKTVILWQPPT